MMNRRILPALLLTAMLAPWATLTQAQSTEQSGEEQQQAQTANDPRGRPQSAIVGTWLSVTPTGNKFIGTFHEGGTVQFVGQHDLSVPAGTGLTARQGVWKHLGGRQFGVTVLAVRYNLNTTGFLAYLKINYLLTVSEDGNVLTGATVARTLDLDGNVLSTTPNNNIAPYFRIKLEPFN